jgi:hypothetical protein
MNAFTTSQCALTSVIAEDLSTLNTPVGLWTGSIAGTRTGSPLPAETCLLINFHVNRRYRGGKPRMYLPLGNAGDVSAPQAWLGGFLAAVNTSFSAFLNGVFGSTLGGATVTTLCSVSYYHAKALRTTPLVDPVTAWSTNGIPASQRRRMGR